LGMRQLVIQLLSADPDVPFGSVETGMSSRPPRALVHSASTSSSGGHDTGLIRLCTAIAGMITPAEDTWMTTVIES
jgi:hypothetical protein